MGFSQIEEKADGTVAFGLDIAQYEARSTKITVKRETYATTRSYS
jgi:hypothetical protein